MKEVSTKRSLQEFLKSYPKIEPMRSFQDNEMKLSIPSKSKINEQISEAIIANKSSKNMDAKKNSSNPSNSFNQTCKKQPRKCDNPTKHPSTEDSMESCCPSTWICKNSACKAVLTLDDTFCKRCSCCICHLFDDNKDPSLWLVCSSELDGGDWCGLSCHIECAIQRGKVGVVDHGQFMKLDGSYCCAACGKVSGIIRSWRKQLVIAKDARRQDVLCYRIFLSYRLLDGTSRFTELHKIVDEAKTKLEKEVGAINGVSAKMARGIVSRLSVASDVQRLCSVAIGKADEWLSSNFSPHSKWIDSLPSACRFQFEEINSSSLTILLRPPSSPSPSPSPSPIKGYKLWYYKTRDEDPWKNDPVTFPKSQTRIIVSKLQPCTEYAFRIISFTDQTDLGTSEAKCFTRSVEIIPKRTEINNQTKAKTESKREAETRSTGYNDQKLEPKSSGFNVRRLGKILQLAQSQTDEINKEDSSELCNATKPEVPDLNADATTNTEEENEQETCDGDSTLVDTSPVRFSNGLGQLDENYEYCVKVVRWLECGGYIERGFRMKFLTWFSLRSNEQERRVVVAFIRTLADEPGSLAGQLVDSFFEIVSCKRAKNGFCGKLWH